MLFVYTKKANAISWSYRSNKVEQKFSFLKTIIKMQGYRPTYAPFSRNHLSNIMYTQCLSINWQNFFTNGSEVPNVQENGKKSIMAS